MARSHGISIAARSSRGRDRLRQMNARRYVAKVLGPLYRPIRRVVRFLTWIFPSLGRLLLTVPSSDRRLLLIYDTSSQPFNIGDILILQEGSLVLREKY